MAERARLCALVAPAIWRDIVGSELAFAVSHDWTDADLVHPPFEKAIIMEQARLALQYCGATPKKHIKLD